MGGTTAKAAILEDGLPVKTSEYEVGAGINLSSRLIKGGGHAIRLPFIDLSEIGAGGGSLVSVDEFGMLHVGPESAGADPGPACYGLGGDAPTLTDALVVLGYLNPEHLAGGAVAIDAGAAARALESVAAPLGRERDRGRLRRLPARRRDDDASGEGGLDLPRPGSARLRALRLRRQRPGRRGRDRARAADAPRARAARARRLQRGRPAPVRDRARVRADAAGPRRRAPRRRCCTPATASSRPRPSARSSPKASRREAIVVSRFADIRYAGQAYELTLPVAAGAPDLGRIAADFDAEHHRTYGHASADAPIDIVNLKLTARAAGNGDAPYDPLAGLAADGTSERTRRAYFGPEHGSLDVAGDLARGAARLAAARGAADRRGVRRDLRRPAGLPGDARLAREHRHRPRQQ